MTDEKTKRHPVGLSQKPESWDDFFAAPVRVTNDFMTEREACDDFEKERLELLDDDRVSR